MWSFFMPKEASWYGWQLNGAKAYLHRRGGEWRTAVLPIRYEQIIPGATGPRLVEAPAETAVSLVVARNDQVALRPSFPERPYIVIVNNGLKLIGGAEARFDIGLPVNFRWQLASGVILAEFLPFSLSNAWFGDKTSGTLCYSLPKTLDPLCTEESPLGYTGLAKFQSLVHCVLRVRNSSKNTIELQQLAVYTDLLAIYTVEGGLRTDEVVIDGLADGSLRTTLGLHGPKDHQLVAARASQQELFIRRGVSFLRAITGM